MYGDALAASAVVLIILPVILHVYWIGTWQMREAYLKDRILQDTASFIEEGKSFHGDGRKPDTTDGLSHFRIEPMHSVIYVRTLSDERIEGILMWRYTVRAVMDGQAVYELSTLLTPLP